jgi:hypothetical protein
VYAGVTDGSGESSPAQPRRYPGTTPALSRHDPCTAMMTITMAAAATTATATFTTPRATAIPITTAMELMVTMNTTMMHTVSTPEGGVIL